MDTFLPIFFGLITLVTLLIMIKATNANKSFIFFLIIWVIIIGINSFLGFFENTESLPPRFVFIIAPVILWVIYFYKKLRNTEVRIPWLLSLHVLRIPVEITLYYLFIQQLIPQAMTFEGWNFDIFSGITALILLVMVAIAGVSRWQKLIYYWNYFGLLLLAMIVITAILSAPTPLQQINFNQPNVAVLQFPYTFLPALVVPLVALSHLLLLNKLKPKA